MVDWEDRVARAVERHDDGLARLPDDPGERQRQLTRTGNAAWAAGLSLLMLGREGEAAVWLGRVAERYRDSWPDAPPGSWGRPIGAMKACLIAEDLVGARSDAQWALETGAGESESPIGRYAAALAHLVRGEDAEAGRLAPTLQCRDDFPRAIADALAALAVSDGDAYDPGVRAVLADFESRDAFLEDVPVADTVLVLQTLAEPRGLAVPLSSPLLPA